MWSHTDSIRVQRDIHEVFDFITDSSNIEIMFEHIVNIVPVPEEKSAGRKFRQIRLVHGIKWPEVVEITGFEKNTHIQYLRQF